MKQEKEDETISKQPTIQEQRKDALNMLKAANKTKEEYINEACEYRRAGKYE